MIIKPDVVDAHRPKLASEEGAATSGGGGDNGVTTSPGGDGGTDGTETTETEKLPTRFVGTVMISADRPARDMHQIVEAIVEQLTTIPGGEVSLKLEIEAEISSGLDRSKVRTLLENTATLGFIDKSIS
ncbi:MAG: hypothetical protein OXC68_08600 [Aestuariivita sp.]|nr:hypothetical protein [Aestuariivita sp.]